MELSSPLTDALQVSQRFGENPDFYREFGLSGHEGLDYAVLTGTPVLACHAGRCDPRWGPVYGNYIRLYGDGLMTLYAHLLRTGVGANQEVVAGDVLGLSGNTGRTTGPHLHLGLAVDGLDSRRFGGWIDPEPWLKKGGEMGQKTTLHVQRVERWMRGVMADWGPDWIKLVNPGSGPDPFPELPNKNVRLWTDDIDAGFIARGEEGGRDFVRHMLPRWGERPWATAYSLANEAGCNGNQELWNLRDYSIGAMREASAQGIRVVIWEVPEGNPHDNGTGDPVITEWKVKEFAPAILEAVRLGHYVGRHCYWRPQVEGPLGRYHALGRLERDVGWWADAGVPLDGLQVLVSEWGIDGGIAGHEGKQGWLEMLALGLLTFEEYMAQIVEGERRARQLPWLKGLFLFDAGFEPPWATFNHDEGTCRSISRVLPPTGEQPAPQPDDGLTPMELANARKMWETFPISKKHAMELGWDHIDETRVFPGFVVYALRNPETGAIHAFKREDRTWEIVDEQIL